MDTHNHSLSRRSALSLACAALFISTSGTAATAGGDGGGKKKKPVDRPTTNKAIAKRDLQKAEQRYLKIQKEITRLNDKIKSLENKNAQDEWQIEQHNDDRANNDVFVKLHEKEIRELERQVKLGKSGNGKKMDEVSIGITKGEIKHVKRLLKPHTDEEDYLHRQVKRLRARIKKRNAEIKRIKAGIREYKDDLKLIDEEIVKLEKYLS